jgi:hypothetical protein
MRTTNMRKIFERLLLSYLEKIPFIVICFIISSTCVCGQDPVNKTMEEINIPIQESWQEKFTVMYKNYFAIALNKNDSQNQINDKALLYNLSGEVILDVIPDSPWSITRTLNSEKLKIFMIIQDRGYDSIISAYSMSSGELLWQDDINPVGEYSVTDDESKIYTRLGDIEENVEFKIIDINTGKIEQNRFWGSQLVASANIDHENFWLLYYSRKDTKTKQSELIIAKYNFISSEMKYKKQFEKEYGINSYCNGFFFQNDGNKNVLLKYENNGEKFLASLDEKLNKNWSIPFNTNFYTIIPIYNQHEKEYLIYSKDRIEVLDKQNGRIIKTEQDYSSLIKESWIYEHKYSQKITNTYLLIMQNGKIKLRKRK